MNTTEQPASGDTSAGAPVECPVRGTGTPGEGTRPTGNVGRVPPRGVPLPPPGDQPPPRRLRRLDRVWPDRDGNVSYLITICVQDRARVLDNDTTFQRLTAFLLDSPARYDWFPRRFVLMPDHLHLIAHQGHESVRLGQWIKALKAVVGGLERRAGDAGSMDHRSAGSGDPAYREGCVPSRGEIVGRLPSAGPPPPPPGVLGAAVGRVPPPGVPPPSPGVLDPAVGPVPSPGAVPSPGDPPSPTGETSHEFTRIKRSWHWQEGFHDHKFRTPESEQRKWEYVCLNPVRYGLVERPEQWPYGGEIFHKDASGPNLVSGTPPLFEKGLFREGVGDAETSPIPTPTGGSRPTGGNDVCPVPSPGDPVGRVPPRGASARDVLQTGTPGEDTRPTIFPEKPGRGTRPASDLKI